MNRPWGRRFGASVAVTLMAVGLGILSGSTAQADTIQPRYTCGLILPSQLLGNLTWIATNCTGPTGHFARGTINTTPVCNVSATAQNNGSVTVFARPYCR